MLKVYNTLTGKKEEFKPHRDGQVNMYVCGPTVYNYIHLGNARPLVVFDTVRRYLIHKGYKVKYVQNFTDVDDKIINRAKEEGVLPLELSKKYIEEYFKDADALNIMRADYHPLVSENISDIIHFIQLLIEKGYAYEAEGDVYFKVRKFEGYGKLSGRSFDDMLAGARVEVNEKKQDPLDFALWKKAKEGELNWNSPWGEGRPGWHIECSVMAHKYLGDCIDIHGGGYDLVFPHHENEIAQSEAALGKQFVKYWMHNGFITVNKEKMSKSLGNFFLVRDILKKFRPEAVRFYLLSTHYRSPLDFDDEKLESFQNGLRRLENAWELLDERLEGFDKSDSLRDDKTGNNVPELLTEKSLSFEQAMDDDFNTALAIAVWFDLVKEVNIFLKRMDENDQKAKGMLLGFKELFLMFNEVLGIFKTDDTGKLKSKADEDNMQDSNLINGLMEIIIDLRQKARKEKDWDTADGIRDRLKELGIILEDTPQGVRWKLNR